MKTIYIALSLIMGMQVMAASGDYREFTDAQGRKITAKIVFYNVDKDKVTIQLKGQRSNKTVPISIFSNEDQQYIKSWSEYQDFLNERVLKASFKRFKNKDENNSSSGSSWERKNYDCTFLIELQNRSMIDFKNVKCEYVIFYDQEHTKNNNTMKETRKGTFYTSKTIDLNSKSSKEIRTEKVNIHHYKVVATSYGRPDLEGEILGIRLKLTLKTKSGESISREFAFPDTLKRPWTSKTKNVELY